MVQPIDTIDHPHSREDINKNNWTEFGSELGSVLFIILLIIVW